MSGIDYQNNKKEARLMNQLDLQQMFWDVCIVEKVGGGWKCGRSELTFTVIPELPGKWWQN